MKAITYEILNVASEVVFEGSSTDCLRWLDDSDNELKADKIREKDSKVGQISLPVSLWLPLAKRIQAHIQAQEDKKTKKEDKKKCRKKKKISSKSVRVK